MDDGLKEYFESTKKPWGEMFYRLIWEQLPQITGSKILDFGSGLGITANHFAKDNDVVAIEPNAGMIEMRIRENGYEQILGDIQQLSKQPDNFFDIVLCHNVLEYAKERKDIFRELCRALKPGGLLSILKHNHKGRIMSKAVFENNLDEAIMLLDGGKSSAAYFGEINYYCLDDIKEWTDSLSINIENVLGLRTFYALHQNNEIRYDPTWQEKMFKIEMKASRINDYINIAFYNHILLRKFV